MDDHYNILPICDDQIAGTSGRLKSNSQLFESTFSFLLLFQPFMCSFSVQAIVLPRGSIPGWRRAFSRLESRHGISFSVIKGLSRALYAPVQVPTSLPAPSPSSGVKAKMEAGIENN